MPQYVELNTIVDTNETVSVKQLNGRQGDGNKVITFHIMDGADNHDLTGETVTLYAKDSTGVVKTASTVKDSSNETNGYVSLLIPPAFYQASGQTVDSYLRISDGNGYQVSSLKLSFNVIADTMLISSSASSTYIDTINQLVADFKKNFNPNGQDSSINTQKLTDLENEVSALTTSFNNLLTNNNDFKGVNTFDQKIVGNLQGKSDSAGMADVANGLNQNNSYQVSSLTANKIIQPTVNKSLTIAGMPMTLARTGNVVTFGMVNSIWTGGDINPYSMLTGVQLPAGFRPVATQTFAVEYLFATTSFSVFTDGTISIHDKKLPSNVAINAGMTFITADDMPN